MSSDIRLFLLLFSSLITFAAINIYSCNIHNVSKIVTLGIIQTIIYQYSFPVKNR